MDLLIPASGFATRMNGIPKFLLPIDELGLTLLQTHIMNAEKYYENILIGVRSGLQDLINATLLSPKVKVYEMNTSTMTQTVLRLIDESKSSRFSVIMPDTYFLGANPHENFSLNQNGLNIAAWKIRADQRGKLGQLELNGNQIVSVVDKNPNCDFTHAWGAMSFSADFKPFLNPDSPHIGHGLSEYLLSNLVHEVAQVQGQYFDCGTPREYFRLLRELNF